MPSNHVLIEARPSALGKHRIEDTPRGTHHAARPTYSAFLEDLVDFRLKPNTQDCVRLAGFGRVSASPPPPAQVRPTSKVPSLNLQNQVRPDSGGPSTDGRRHVPVGLYKEQSGLSTALGEAHPVQQNQHGLYHSRCTPYNPTNVRSDGGGQGLPAEVRQRQHHVHKFLHHHFLPLKATWGTHDAPFRSFISMGFSFPNQCDRDMARRKPKFELSCGELRIPRKDEV